MEYQGLPCAAPGRATSVMPHMTGELLTEGAELALDVASGWEVLPVSVAVTDERRIVRFVLRPRIDPSQVIGLQECTASTVHAP